MIPVIDTVAVPDDTLCVRLSGEIDLASAPSLRATLFEAIGSARHVLVRADRVTFLDCAALGALNRARVRAIEHGSRLSLVQPAHPVTRLLKLTGLMEQFDTYPDLESALEAVRSA